MIRTSLFALIIAAPSWAAEVVTITSGEHDGFTRLVLRVDPANGWSLKQDNRAAELTITAPDFTFNEANIFTRIAKTRLLSTSTEDKGSNSSFHMNLACACRVNAYEYLDTYIVIDIFDADGSEEHVSEVAHVAEIRHRTPQLWSSESNEFARAAPSAISSLAPQPPRFFGTIAEEAFPEQAMFTTVLDPEMAHDMTPEVPHPDSGMHEEMVEEIPQSALHSEEHMVTDVVQIDEHLISEDEHMDAHMESADTPSDPHAAPDDHMMVEDENTTPIDDDLAETVAMARTQLLQQLTMAAERGLLEFDGPIPHDTSEDEPEELVQEMVEEHHEPEPTHPLDDRQIRVQSVYDRDAGATEILELLAAHNTCPTEESLDIASWGSGADFSDEIAVARTTMLREFDEPNLSAVTDLIHIYIRYGFGIEAATYLTDYDMIPNHALLVDMAAIVDGNSAKMGGALSRASSCSGAVGLWAIIGAYPAIDAPLGDVASIINAFAEMPVDLRRMAGPRLATAFLARGLAAEASIVSDILERAPGDHGEMHVLSMADIALDHGAVDEAVNLYDDLIDEKTDVSTDALIRLAEITLNEGRHMANDFLVDLGAAADEARGTTKGTELRRLEALWIAELSGGSNALELLSDEIERDHMTANLLEQAAREVLWSMSSDISPDEYVETITEYANFIAEGSDGYDLRVKVGKELLDAGLPNVALEILQLARDPENLDGRLLAARANLQMYRPDVSLTLLADVTEDEAKLMRIEANLGLAYFDEALKDLKALENQELALVDLVWFSGNWKKAAAENPIASEILHNYTGQATDTMFTESVPVNEPSSLLEIQNVLDSSSAASNELAAILDDQ